ncbi:MAG: hypothetical protein HDKAJFGB_01372 [Anaerolineae bacterium]|nr:hypothetical protein [Anaerolineae bacterium]
MQTRIFLTLAGAAGMVLAALFYFLAEYAQGALSFLLLLPSAGFVIFGLLLFISFGEIFVMTAGLRRLAARLPTRLLYLVAAGYVAFAGAYALLYALLVPDPRGIQILAALCLARWFTLFLIAPLSQTK